MDCSAYDRFGFGAHWASLDLRFVSSLRIPKKKSGPDQRMAVISREVYKSLEAGWKGLDIVEIVPLDQIARA